MQITVAHAALSTRAHARNGAPGILVIEFPVGKRQGKKLSGRSALYRIQGQSLCLSARSREL